MKLFIILSLACMAISEEPNCREGYYSVPCFRYVLKADEFIKFDSTFEELAFYDSTGSIGSKTFSLIKTLRRLEIIRSNITEIEDGAFCSIPGLKWLDLHGGQVFPVLTDSILNNCQNLEFLEVINVELQPTVFKHLSNLERLSLTELKISRLTKEYFEDMKNLKELRLFQNIFEDIEPDAICAPPKLERIIFEYNKLPTPSKLWFENCSNVKDLTLRFSYGERVDIEDNTFNSLINLGRLEAGYLNIKHLTKTYLSDLVQLDTLILYYANIETIDSDAFSDLKNLRELNLYSNQIQEINPAIFENLNKLTKLILGGNKLTSIDNLKLPEVTALYVDSNSIRTIDVSALHSNVPKLDTFHVHNNPMDCCYKEQLFKDLKKNGVYMKTRDAEGGRLDHCNYTTE